MALVMLWACFDVEVLTGSLFGVLGCVELYLKCEEGYTTNDSIKGWVASLVNMGLLDCSGKALPLHANYAEVVQ